MIYNNGLRCVVDNCTIVSRQDTILINASTSQGYFNNCTVIGNFDYVWGIGVGYFNNCLFRTITNSLSGSYNLTAARLATAGSFETPPPRGSIKWRIFRLRIIVRELLPFTEDPGNHGHFAG